MFSSTSVSANPLPLFLFLLLLLPTPSHTESCVVDCSHFPSDPHCGTNGQTYRNRCELYNAVCLSGGAFREQGITLFS